jgi:chromate reductase, NAD(P)H dehydrogenase (quinone)
MSRTATLVETSNLREHKMTDRALGPATLRVIGIAGSLRAASYNRALLSAARDLAPPELIIEVRELKDLPLFNEDLERDGVPVAVGELRRAVRSADGLLLVTPEYNHGVPGVLKNAVDWLSQPLRQSALEGKPTALMGASTGLAGTARSQSQLRQAFVLTNSPVMQQPEVLVARAHEKFDAMGRLTDQPTHQFVCLFLTRLAQWLAQQKRIGTSAD